MRLGIAVGFDPDLAGPAGRLREHPGMRLLLLVLLLSLAAAAGAEENPYRVRRQAEIWEFQPKRTLYTFTSWVEALRDTDGALGMSTQPVWKGRGFRVRSRGEFEYLFTDRLPYEGPNPYENILAVWKPRKPMKKGQTRWAQLQIEFASVPFLHGPPVGKRMVSLVMPPAESEVQTLLLTFPTPARKPVATDLKPAAVTEVGGWSVYRYEAGALTARSAIHLDFDLAESSKPAPALEKVIPAKLQPPSPGVWSAWKEG